MRREPYRDLTRRRFLRSTAVGLSAIALAGVARAQHATQPPPKPIPPDEFAVTEAVSIEVNARPIPSFDPNDRAHLRFGSLEYRSGLALTSRFPGFGGLSGLRLDPKGERFISFSDKGAVADGPSIFNADLGDEIDNMEGIDAHVTPEGDTVLTMVSDDNFSMIQRTLLLQFTLVE